MKIRPMRPGFPIVSPQSFLIWATPSSGAIHRHHVDLLAGWPSCAGSPGSLEAHMFQLVTDRLYPVSGMALEKLSLTGGSPNKICDFPMPPKRDKVAMIVTSNETHRSANLLNKEFKPV